MGEKGTCAGGDWGGGFAPLGGLRREDGGGLDCAGGGVFGYGLWLDALVFGLFVLPIVGGVKSGLKT